MEKKPTAKQIKEWKSKAEKWDKLDKAIGEFYPEEDENYSDTEEGDLGDIGEIAAMAFGYL